jgi:hypothetical protein
MRDISLENLDVCPISNQEDNINKLLLCFDSHFRLQATSRKRQAASMEQQTTRKVKYAS